MARPKSLIPSDISSTSVSFQQQELDDYKQHAKNLGYSFSRFIKVLFMEDIENMENSKTPQQKLDRIELQKERLKKVGHKPYSKPK